MQPLVSTWEWMGRLSTLPPFQMGKTPVASRRVWQRAGGKGRTSASAEQRRAVATVRTVLALLVVRRSLWAMRTSEAWTKCSSR